MVELDRCRVHKWRLQLVQGHWIYCNRCPPSCPDLFFFIFWLRSLSFCCFVTRLLRMTRAPTRPNSFYLTAFEHSRKNASSWLRYLNGERSCIRPSHHASDRLVRASFTRCATAISDGWFGSTRASLTRCASAISDGWFPEVTDRIFHHEPIQHVGLLWWSIGWCCRVCYWTRLG